MHRCSQGHQRPSPLVGSQGRPCHVSICVVGRPCMAKPQSAPARSRVDLALCQRAARVRTAQPSSSGVEEQVYISWVPLQWGPLKDFVYFWGGQDGALGTRFCHLG
ncbi:hypothetical protein NDU88_006810 [Pleurodeles waltl]|uniref:Uncharacterized protein n=1 Tax=Pleurodeles waltl TaxID=8319 RepID=A0AAV7PJU0_PLEWA|nr:hypothetical protein NDU88_006810 [Pleurodeles waltl]